MSKVAIAVIDNKQEDTIRLCKVCGKPLPSNREGEYHLKCSKPGAGTLKIKTSPARVEREDLDEEQDDLKEGNTKEKKASTWKNFAINPAKKADGFTRRKGRVAKQNTKAADLPALIPLPKFVGDQLSVTVVDVTPAQAESWLAHYNYVHNRRFRKWHAEDLANTMRKRKFRKDTAINFGILAGRPHLVNGQHTLTAVTLYGQPITLVVHQTIVHSEKELEDLYNHHDVGLKRNLADALNASDLPNKTGLTMRQVKFAAAALRILLAGFRAPNIENRNRRISRDDMLEAILDWQAEAQAFNDALRGCDYTFRPAFDRGPVIAVGLITFRYAPEKAREFWTTLAADDGLTKGSPLKVLRNRLLAVRLSDSGEKRGERVTEAHLCRIVAAAWNAWIEGSQIDQIHVKNPNAPIRINLTPYDGENGNGVKVADN
ncbi:MAG: hypothetical protein AB1489_29460 [Acidobacteriota bacterium]